MSKTKLDKQIEQSFCSKDLPLLISVSWSRLNVALEHVDQSLLGLVGRLECAETHVGGQIVFPERSVTFKIKATFFPCGAVSLKIWKVLDRERRQGKVFTYRASRLGFLWSQLQLDGELPDELSEEVLVAVLRELVHHEPVGHLTLGEDILQALRNVLVVLVTNLPARWVKCFL